ncbi:hypothetical protein BS630_34460 [Rhizobium laguerreae]|nr:hypothetical protein BS630_34460 [Rhizobium laguerreae]
MPFKPPNWLGVYMKVRVRIFHQQKSKTTSLRWHLVAMWGEIQVDAVEIVRVVDGRRDLVAFF